MPLGQTSVVEVLRVWIYYAAIGGTSGEYNYLLIRPCKKNDKKFSNLKIMTVLLLPSNSHCNAALYQLSYIYDFIIF